MKAFKITCIVFTTIALLLTIFATGMYIGVELSTYIQDYKDLKSTNSELQIGINQLNDQNSNIKDELNKLETTNQDLQNVITQLEVENKLLNDDIDALETSNRDLQNVITQLEVENKLLNDDIDALETFNKTLEDENKQLQIDIGVLETSNQDLQNVINKLKSENELLNDDIGVLVGEIINLEDYTGVLLDEIINLKETIISCKEFVDDNQFCKTKLLNSFWHHNMDNFGNYIGYQGNIEFSNLRELESYSVSFRDDFLNQYHVETINDIVYSNTIYVSFVDVELDARYCELQLNFSDGRIETFWVQIAMG